MVNKLFEYKEYGAAGLYEEPDRSLFYRKALGLRRFYEHCEVPAYRGELLYPSGRIFCPNYMNGLAVDWKNLEQNCQEMAERIREDFMRYRSTVPKEHTVAGDMYTHSMPNYERILAEGLISYIPRIEKIGDRDMREGLLHLVEGICSYVERCVAYLISVQAQEKLVEALKQVPLYPARDIYEAVVAWNFVLYLDSCDNLGSVSSGLKPYHKGEDITDLLRNLYSNLDENGGYSMAIGAEDSPLTVQCLEASKGKRRPMIELFVDENTPEEIWEKAFEVIRTSNGQPAFYNPKALLGGLQKRFPVITDADVKKFCGGGCTEAMLAGLSCVGSLDAGINLPLILEQCMKTELETAESFEEFYRKYIAAAEEVMAEVTREIGNSQRERAKLNPLPLRTLMVDDCIDNGLDFNNGGARYQWSIVNIAGMINVIDAMLVIRDLVFTEKVYTPSEMLKLLADNDTGLLERARKHPVSFGTDSEDANAFTKRLSEDIYSMLDDKKPYFGEGFLPASIQFMSQVGAGKPVGATPDGRTAGSPLCDSLAAIFGKDVKGPTALLNSVTQLDLKRALGVPVLNFNVNPGFRNEILKTLILGYMKQGGIQMQITCVSGEMLEDAYQNPENYRNLVVRVGGYSEYFCRLSDELKRMVIERTIQSKV